ncbi:hypothetical protein FGO68_gene1056 [Halteria grandinella]|uniref:Uncharacterized protein n=1 Tax=Halteria grandinella TaxID=5974 RepID=A0A8J8P2H8_HALGN|nr:hypothetical protein FGO68_gene1056 [Halteria grandinella]
MLMLYLEQTYQCFLKSICASFFILVECYCQQDLFNKQWFVKAQRKEHFDVEKCTYYQIVAGNRIKPTYCLFVTLNISRVVISEQIGRPYLNV